MAQTASAQHSPPDMPKRPKGILKNSHSYQQSSEDHHTSPTFERSSSSTHHEPPSAPSTSSSDRPAPPNREMSEKEITQMNTEANAGEHRRSPSNARGSISRRQSSQSGSAEDGSGDGGMRLKWDEANLYLNEGQMGGKMKIDEPKTPFVHSQDLPEREEEEETTALDPKDLNVDELEMGGGKSKSAKGGSAQEDIPDIDIGQPEMDIATPPKAAMRRESDGLDRKVSLGGDPMDVDGARHGEHEEEMSGPELEKHRKFEEARKRHYEMKNIKGLLGHAEALDDEEDER